MKRLLSLFLAIVVVASSVVIPDKFKVCAAYNPYDTSVSLHIKPVLNNLWDVHPFFDSASGKWYMFYVTPGTWESKLMTSNDMINWVETPIIFNGTPQQPYYVLGVIKDQTGAYKSYFGNWSISAQSYSSNLLTWNWGGYGVEVPTNMSVWSNGSRDPYLFYNPETNNYNVVNTASRSTTDHSIALTKSIGLGFTTWGAQTELRRFPLSTDGVPECTQIIKIGNCWYLTAAINKGAVAGTSYWIGDANATLSQINWSAKPTCTQLTNSNLKTAQLAPGQNNKTYLFGFINDTNNINLPLEVYQLPDTRLGARLSSETAVRIRGSLLSSLSSNGVFTDTYGRFDMSSNLALGANSSGRVRISNGTSRTDVVFSTIDNSVVIENRYGNDFVKIYTDAGDLTNCNFRIVQEGNIMEVYVNDKYHLVAKIDRNTSGDTVATSSITGTANFTSSQIYELMSASQLVAVTGVTLNRSTTSIYMGNPETLVATVQPPNAGNKKVSWSSSNSSVATVDANGTVSPVSSGMSTITATTIDGSKTATCNFTVKSIGQSMNINNDFESGWITGWLQAGEGDGFSIINDNLDPQNHILRSNSTTSYNSIYFGEYIPNIVYEFDYKNNFAGAESWGGASLRCGPSGRYDVALMSSTFYAPSCVRIYRAGAEVAYNSMPGVGQGNPYMPVLEWANVKIVMQGGRIRVYVNNLLTIDYTDNEPLTDGGFGLRASWADVSYDNIKYYTPEELCVAPVSGVQLGKSSSILHPGETETLTSTVLPVDAANKGLTWSTSNPDVVSVTNGLVTANSNGFATITVSTSEGNFTASCAYEVKSPLSSIAYNISSQNRITNLTPGTTVSAFRSNISLALGYDATFEKIPDVPLAENELVGTGTNIIISNDYNIKEVFSIIIYGDVNGDGEIKIDDMTSVKKHLLNIQSLTEDNIIAGDLTRNSSITVSDLLSIKKGILNIQPITQT